MSTVETARLLWLEAAAIAVGYAAFGAAGHARFARLTMVLAIHALVGFMVGLALGMPGEVGGHLAVRALFAAQSLAAFGLAAALTRLRLDAGVAAAISAAVMLALVCGPALGEALAAASDDPATVRTRAHAASPAFAATIAIGLDIRLDASLYARLPSAIMEMHMIPWYWTALAFGGAGLALVTIAALRRPRPGRALAATLVAVVALGALGACKKKEPAGTATGSGTATATASGSGAATGTGAATGATPTGPSTAAIDASMTRGVDFLASQRGEGDLIGGHPGTTALAALAMVSSGAGKDDPRVAPSLAALAKLAKPDGAIFDKDYPVYVTAISVLAFQKAGVEPELVKKGQAWLAGKQFDENNKVDAKDPNYGGVGYGVDEKHPDADLSNLHFALDAIKDAELSNHAEVLARAQKFVERCQNRTESNDQAWAGNDGGFVYKPGASKAGATASSGSMTYAGIASFLYTRADAKDPRVVAALDYIRANYSVDENPGMGAKGLFYHYHMMARALGLVGERTIVDSDGQAHDWPAELAAKLAGMQKPDGSWANTDETFWENNPSIATARAVLALAHARAAMK